VNAPIKQLPLVSMDKSFAHAVSARRLAAFCKKCEFLVPSAFYYEIFDTAPENRPRTLAGFDDFRRVDLPTLFQREARTGKAVEEMDAPLHFFNPDILSPKWKLSPDEMVVQNNYKTHVVDRNLAFWNSMLDERKVLGFSDEMAKYAAEMTALEFTSLCKTLRNRERIREIASELGFPHASIIDESWFYFRHCQASALQGLILARRHANPKDLRSQERLEHDIHDIQYLTLGLMTRHLATNETSNDFNKYSMKWRFELLRPDGLVITPATLPSLL
jgi:hypothetical protein